MGRSSEVAKALEHAERAVAAEERALRLLEQTDRFADSALYRVRALARDLGVSLREPGGAVVEESPVGTPPVVPVASDDDLAAKLATALAPRLKGLLRAMTAAGVPSDDSFIDQDAGLFDREVYLLLARQKAFPVRKVGKKRIARWKDVKAAFIGANATVTLAEPTEDPEADLLNEIRQRTGLAVRGGR